MFYGQSIIWLLCKQPLDFQLFQHFSFFPPISWCALPSTLRIALLYLICLWKVLVSSSVRCSSSGSGSEGPAVQAMPAGSAGGWMSARVARCSSAPFWRRSWSGCPSSCSFMLRPYINYHGQICIWIAFFCLLCELCHFQNSPEVKFCLLKLRGKQSCAKWSLPPAVCRFSVLRVRFLFSALPLLML